MSGCSNKGKYSDVPPDMFCGPAGGACRGTYPVNTPQRARAALSYARHAPNPEGIRQCVYKKADEQGWMDHSTGRLIMSNEKVSKTKTVYMDGQRYRVMREGDDIKVIKD